MRGRSRSARRRGLFALLVALAAAGGAAGAGPPAAAEVDFTVFSPEPIEGLAYRATADAVLTCLVFQPTARSRRYHYAGPRHFTLYASPPPDARQNVAETENAGVDLPAGAGEVLLLIRRAGSSSGRAGSWRVQAFDESLFPDATVSVLNFSGLELRGSIGDRAAVLPDGAQAAAPAGRVTEVDLRTPLNGRLYRSCTIAVTLSGGRRGLLLLFPPFHPGSIEVQTRLLSDAPIAIAPPVRQAPARP